jgi:hypothetical protein
LLGVLVIEARSFSVNGAEKIFQSTQEEKGHGVSLLHLLDKLYGWEESPSAFPTLRFQPGQRVRCRMGPDAPQEFVDGTIVQVWYREPKWPKGDFAPYKIRVAGGEYIFAPCDRDRVVSAIEND